MTGSNDKWITDADVRTTTQTGRHRLVLWIDGFDWASIETEMRRTGRGYKHRSTIVDFDDFSWWITQPVPDHHHNPDQDRWSSVSVRDTYTDDEVACTIGSLPSRRPRRQSCEAQSRGQLFKLQPAWPVRTTATINDHATIRRTGLKRPSFSFTSETPVPLSIVLLHVHLLLGRTDRGMQFDWGGGGAGV
ncbi:MAG: hypothetical protein ACR2N7_09790 [Acidimicrobiia bacterium]